MIATSHLRGAAAPPARDHDRRRPARRVVLLGVLAARRLDQVLEAVVGLVLVLVVDHGPVGDHLAGVAPPDEVVLVHVATAVLPARIVVRRRDQNVWTVPHIHRGSPSEVSTDGASRRSRTAWPAYRAGALPEGVERRELRDQGSNLESAGSGPAVLPVTPSRKKLGREESNLHRRRSKRRILPLDHARPSERSGRRDSNPHHPAWKAGARPSSGGRDRGAERVTGVEPAWYSLGSCCLASSASPARCARQDSNLQPPE